MPLLIQEIRRIDIIGYDRYHDEKDALALSPDEILPREQYVARLIAPYARVLEDTSRFAVECMMIARARPEHVERKSRITRYPLRYSQIPLQPALLLPNRPVTRPRTHAMDDAGTIYTRRRLYSIAPLNVELGYLYSPIDPESFPEFED